MKTIGARGMKVMKLLHLIATMMWTVGLAGIAVLMSGSFCSPIDVALTFRKVLDIDFFLVIPGAQITIILGLIYGIFTHWRFFKHRWITLKWFVAISVILSGRFIFHPLCSEVIDFADLGIVQYNPQITNLIFKCQILNAVQIAALLFLVGISVFKPWLGERQKTDNHHTATILLLLIFLFPLQLKATKTSPGTQAPNNQKQLSESWDWHNPMTESTPPLHGRAWNKETGVASFARIPERLKPQLPPAVYKLAQQSAGISVRFITNSSNICVRMKTANKSALTNMSSLNESGVDLYAVMPHGVFHWLGTHQQYRFARTEADTTRFYYRNISVESPTEYLLYLPNYNTVTFLEIGIDEGSSFYFVAPSAEKPVVVYGSSIIQGASPSRPGLSITNIVQRNLNMPVINLGFSGNCFMEPALFKALAEIDARAYIIDPIPNSHRLSENEIIKRITEGIDILRQKNNTPVVLVQNYAASDSVMMKASYASYLAANTALYKAYKTMKRQGIKNIYLLRKEKLVLGEEGMIEGSHPNDLGTMVYARAYTDILQKILGRKPSYK